MQACISAYPGTDEAITGKVAVTFDSETDDLTYSFKFRDVESNVVAGTHIHSGTTCDDASLVGGHYWDEGDDGSNPDPWTAEYGAVYSTNAIGSASGDFTLNSGYGFDENKGHAVVVHAEDGSRIGCGVLGTSKTKGCGSTMTAKKLQACVGAYPGTESTASGKIVVTFDTATDDLTYSFKLRGLESSVVGAGTHIHSGTTCDDASLVGGHYWDEGDDGSNPDPWTSEYGAVYNTNDAGAAVGNFTINSGYSHAENIGHAVVVHASDGSRVGCGLLGVGKAKCGQ